MSACYECSLCHEQYSDLDPAMLCCSEEKAAMAGLSGQALMSMSQAIRMEERAAVLAWMREADELYFSWAIEAIEAGDHLS
ncbi:MAG: hypothetical protein ACKOXK_03980 [Chakrabartia sp.]